jgi:hypothetical protein
MDNGFSANPGQFWNGFPDSAKKVAPNFAAFFQVWSGKGFA